MAVTQIDDYEVMYSSNTFSPRIWLKHQGRYIGQLVFEPNGASLPADTQDSLYYHLDDFHNVLDLLRNEKPMYRLFSGAENGVKTTAEPIGEGEA